MGNNNSQEKTDKMNGIKIGKMKKIKKKEKNESLSLREEKNECMSFFGMETYKINYKEKLNDWRKLIEKNDFQLIQSSTLGYFFFPSNLIQTIHFEKDCGFLTGDIKLLFKDNLFMTDYASAVIYFCKSLGWDVVAQKPIETMDEDNFYSIDNFQNVNWDTVYQLGISLSQFQQKFFIISISKCLQFMIKHNVNPPVEISKLFPLCS